MLTAGHRDAPGRAVFLPLSQNRNHSRGPFPPRVCGSQNPRLFFQVRQQAAVLSASGQEVTQRRSPSLASSSKRRFQPLPGAPSGQICPLPRERPLRDVQMFTLSCSRPVWTPCVTDVQTGHLSSLERHVELGKEHTRSGDTGACWVPSRRRLLPQTGSWVVPAAPERPTAPSTCECGAAGVRKRPSEGPIGGLGRTAEFVHRKDSTSATVCN